MEQLERLHFDDRASEKAIGRLNANWNSVSSESLPNLESLVLVQFKKTPEKPSPNSSPVQSPVSSFYSYSYNSSYAYSVHNNSSAPMHLGTNLVVRTGSR